MFVYDYPLVSMDPGIYGNSHEYHTAGDLSTQINEMISNAQEFELVYFSKSKHTNTFSWWALEKLLLEFIIVHLVDFK